LRQIQIADVFDRSFQVLVEKPVNLSAKREVAENQSALVALTFIFHDDKTSILQPNSCAKRSAEDLEGFEDSHSSNINDDSHRANRNEADCEPEKRVMKRHLNLRKRRFCIATSQAASRCSKGSKKRLGSLSVLELFVTSGARVAPIDIECWMT
jgi:hypothetical protein